MISLFKRTHSDRRNHSSGSPHKPAPRNRKEGRGSKTSDPIKEQNSFDNVVESEKCYQKNKRLSLEENSTNRININNILDINLHHPIIHIDVTELQNDVNLWNIEGIVKKSREELRSQLIHPNERLIFGGETVLTLPATCKQCDKEAFLLKRYTRRNAVHIYDGELFNSILYSYISLTNVISITW